MDIESTAIGNLFFASFVANLGSFLFGYDFGAASWLISWFENYADDDTTSYYSVIGNNDNLIGLVGASALFGAVLTYIVLLLYGNKMSKRDELLVSSFLYFSGALMQSMSVYADWTTSKGFIVLIVGRWVYGAGIATAMHSAPVYATTIGPMELRGTVGATTEVMAALGIFFSYIVGYYNSSNTGWTVIFRVGYIVAFVMGCLTLFLPQLPLYLIQTGQPNSAIIDSLQFIFPGAGNAEVDLIRQTIDNAVAERERLDSSGEKYNKGVTCLSFIHQFLSPELQIICSNKSIRTGLMLIVFLVFSIPLSGLVALMYYANTIFSYLDSDSVDVYVLGLGAIKVIAALAMLFIADWFGRREFILCGQTILCGGLSCFVVGYHYDVATVAIAGAYVAVCGFEMSLGTFSWVLVSEVFPDCVRSAANSIVISTLLLLMGAMNFVLPTLLNYVGVMNLFLFFISVVVVQFVVVFLYLPETKDVPIEQAYKSILTQLDSSHRRYCSFCCTPTTPSMSSNVAIEEGDNQLFDPNFEDEERVR